MNDNNKLEKRSSDNMKFRLYVDKIIRNSTMYLQSNFRHLDIHNYTYNADNAVEELGLDDALIHQLIEDYVAQILKSKVQFLELLSLLKKDREANRTLNFVPFRELAHKNLGVARNLRIEDAKKILEELMKSDDFEYISKCLTALESCAIRLKPLCAYETIKLIRVKSSLPL